MESQIQIYENAFQNILEEFNSDYGMEGEANINAFRLRRIRTIVLEALEEEPEWLVKLSAINDRIHEEKPTGRKVKIKKAKKND